MGVYFDCSEETVSKFGHCVEKGLPVTPVPEDIIELPGIGVGLNLHQLLVIYVLFVMILGIIVTVVNQPRKHKNDFTKG